MADDRLKNSSNLDHRDHRRLRQDLKETEKLLLSGKGGATKLREESAILGNAYIKDGPTPMQRNKSNATKSHLEGPAQIISAPKVYKASNMSSLSNSGVDQDEDPISARSSREAPHSVQIVLARDDHTFDLDDLALERILMRDEVKDRFVVIVSVAGGFRKGKSFMLDFFLRYLKNIGSTQWLGKEDEPLDGFSWRGGAERDTTGILIWSEPFLIDTPSGDKVAVILMDTQGAFDSESTVRDCATVFALSTMISSVQIYNLLHNIQEDDLQHLQLFTEYGKLALADSGATPFQKLQFLVRDWSFPYEAPFGSKGGEQLLNKRLKISEKQHSELQALRKHIRSCFSSIGCFLMPHPGLRVATNPDFDGKLAEIEVEFKKHLEIFVPELLAPENLVIKEIAGQKIKAKELLQYFKSYIEMYKGNELPEPKSMLLATAEANNLAAVATAKETYQQLMDSVCGGTKPYMNTAHLESEHMRIKEKALYQFNSKRKMGGEEFSESYREKLDKDLEDMLANFRTMNESKNVFKAARTPAVYFALAVGFYIASGLFGLLGLYTLANSANFLMGIALLTLIIWAYIRYSGEFREIGTQLDEIASFLWENFMKPAYQNFLEQQMRTAAIHYAESAASSAIGGSAEGSSSSQVNGRLKHS